MALTTSLAGRVRNTSLPKSHALLPLLEAIVNGIQAIDARPGDSDDRGRIDAATHEAQHTSWSLGLRIPRTVSWGGGDLALVTTQSRARWRRLAEDVARIPRRENHYDFASWDSCRYATEDPDNRRVYLLRFKDWVVGYLVAADLSEHRRLLDFNTKEMDPAIDFTRRPSIDLIWVAAVHRRRGLGRKLVQQLAEDVGCTLAEVSWSIPFSQNGLGIARSIGPDGVWIHR